MPDAALTIMKLCFLALLYLVLARVVRVVVLEMRPSAAAERAPAPPAPGRDGGGKAKADARLRLLEPPGRRDESFDLGDELTVGRGSGCGIVLADDHYVSTVHARVFRRDGTLHVEDLGSRNGTFVNDHRIDGPTPLRRGDRVKFGSTTGEITR
jgi:pSer/pThr/pTyr-binding forkhead associated (FHA) protein